MPEIREQGFLIKSEKYGFYKDVDSNEPKDHFTVNWRLAAVLVGEELRDRIIDSILRLPIEVGTISYDYLSVIREEIEQEEIQQKVVEEDAENEEE